MAKQRRSRLKVTVDGKRRYITVPFGRSSALHTYLRDHRVNDASIRVATRSVVHKVVPAVSSCSLSQ